MAERCRVILQHALMTLNKRNLTDQKKIEMLVRIGGQKSVKEYFKQIQFHFFQIHTKTN